MHPGSPPQAVALLARQRLLVVGSLVAVVAMSWAYLFWLAQDMSSFETAAGAMHAPGFSWTLIMWVVMMTAMMLPTAGPMIVMHARFQLGHAPDRSPAPFTGLFALGYVAAWTGYSAIAAAAQMGLQDAAQMHPMAMALTSTPAAAAVLVVAGAFQLSPLKNACLSQCRSPIGFFMTAWRGGYSGALSMGLRHGTFCVACCWALMAVMFVVGTMNMVWILVLTVFMLLEKVAPRPKLVTRGCGIALIFAGVAVLVV